MSQPFSAVPPPSFVPPLPLPRVITRDYARTGGSVVGRVGGASGAAAAAMAGAQTGIIVGAFAGRPGSFLGCIAGAVLGAMIGAVIDDTLLENFECKDWGHTSGHNPRLTSRLQFLLSAWMPTALAGH